MTCACASRSPAIVAHGPVDGVRAQRAARDVDERQRGIQAEARHRVGACAGAQLGPQRVAGHDHARRPGSDARSPRTSPRCAAPGGRRAGWPGPGTAVCSCTTIGTRAAAAPSHDRQRDEAAGGEHDARTEPAQQRMRAQHAGRHVDGEIGDVAPRPVAAQLAGGDRVVGDACSAARRASTPSRLPIHAWRTPALAQESGDGEAGARVAAGAAARDHDRTGCARAATSTDPGGAPGRGRPGAATRSG